MSYQGGKKHLGKRIYTVIEALEEYFYNDMYLTTYIEPFVGFCGVMKHFAENNHENKRKLLGYDKNIDIIKMWIALQNGWNPPLKCSKAYYDELKNKKSHTAEKGFIGTACSYSGIFFGGGFRTHQQYSHKNVNSLEMTARSVKKTVSFMKDVKFYVSSYDKLKPKNALIYCDPPYFSNTYNSEFFRNFDFNQFWKIMRKWSKNNLVIISERIAPDDFICIWNNKKKVIHSCKTSIQQEKLFIHESLYTQLSSSIIRKIRQY